MLFPRCFYLLCWTTENRKNSTNGKCVEIMIVAHNTELDYRERKKKWIENKLHRPQKNEEKNSAMRELWKIHFGDNNQTMFSERVDPLVMTVECRCWDRCFVTRSFCPIFFFLYFVHGRATKFGPCIWRNKHFDLDRYDLTIYACV